jgi:hypothetical protein
MKTFVTTMLAAAALTTALPATAATTLTRYDFAGTVKRATFGSPIPIDTLSGSMTLSYDDVARTFGLADFNMMLGSYRFDTSNTGLAYNNSPSPMIGGLIGGVEREDGGTYDFHAFLGTQDGALTNISVLQYNIPSVQDFFDSRNVTFTSTPVAAAAVPEAATWAMMVIGFGALGASLRRRQRPALQFG